MPPDATHRYPQCQHPEGNTSVFHQAQHERQHVPHDDHSACRQRVMLRISRVGKNHPRCTKIIREVCQQHDHSRQIREQHLLQRPPPARPGRHRITIITSGHEQRCPGKHTTHVHAAQEKHPGTQQPRLAFEQTAQCHDKSRKQDEVGRSNSILSQYNRIKQHNQQDQTGRAFREEMPQQPPRMIKQQTCPQHAERMGHPQLKSRTLSTMPQSSTPSKEDDNP